MRPLALAGFSIVLLAAAPGSNQPGDIPYSCGNGHLARITYENGGWFVRAKAKLVWDGRTTRLQASPPTYGLRYVSADDAADPILIWTARGEEAWISEISRTAAVDAPARELARCVRIRQGAPPAHAGGGDDH